MVQLASIEDARSIASLVKEIWPEHDLISLERIIGEYIQSTKSDAFVIKINNQIIGVSLVCLRYDYVEECDTSPVGYLEGIVVKKSI